MQRILQHFFRGERRFFWIFLMGVLLWHASAFAWFGKGSKGDADKPFAKKQGKSIARHLVKAIEKDSFFEKYRLPRKVVISLMSVKAKPSEVSDKDFTNMILNAFIDSASHETMILNYEGNYKIGNLDYELSFYSDEWLTRKRGLMLGANFIVTGSLVEEMRMNTNGKIKKEYIGKLYVKDISTNKIIVEKEYSRESKNRKRLRVR